MDLNKVILIGRIASEPELKYTPSGVSVCQFRLAVNRPMSSEARQNGQQNQSDFIQIVAWRQSAEYVAQYLGKGRLVCVEGRLQIREYQTQDGQKRRDAEVVVESLKSLDRPKGDGEVRNSDVDPSDRHGGGNSRPQQRPASATSGTRTYTAPVDDELDDPFAD